MNRRELLAVGGTIAADAAVPVPVRVVQALGVVTSGADRLATVLDHLDELVRYYSDTVCRLPSTSLYDEMLGVRSYAGALLARPGRRPPHWSELIVAAGWLSNLLAVAASYMGDHAAALVWCSDAERRGQEVDHRELAGWAALTKAMIAYYQGRTYRSVTLASLGQEVAPAGTVVHAKLAAQEMRARAKLGDAEGMSRAKRRATAALAALPAEAPRPGGVFSLPPAGEPPYTATSLLLVGEFEQAAAATNRVLNTVYDGAAQHQGKQTSNYARALLILGLSEAGLGHVAEAAAEGKAALNTAKPVWPTMVLADKLDDVLTANFRKVAEVREYHHLYAYAASGTPGRAPQPAVASEDRG